MTLRGPYFLPGLEGSGCLQVRPDKIEDNILVTIGNRSAIKYNVESLNVVCQYFCPSFMKISTPLSHLVEEDKYCCVLNGNKLAVWDDEENHLDRLPTVELKGTAFDMLENSVVFSNGCIQTVSYLLKAKKMDIGQAVLPNKTDVLLQSRRHSDTLVHAFRRQQDFHIQIFAMSVQPVDGQTLVEPVREVVTLPFGDMSLFNLTKDCSSCYLITSSGHLKCLDMQQNSSPRTLTKMPDMKVWSLSPMNEDNLCVLGQAAGQDECRLMVVNVRFGQFVCWTKVKTVDSGNVVCLSDTKIYLKHGHRVAHIFVQQLPRTLADLIFVDGQEIGISDSLATSYPKVEENWQVVNDEKCEAVNLYRTLQDILIQQDVGKAVRLLTASSDVPELLLLNILELFLVASDDKLAGNSREHLLNLAIQIPITESLMAQHLQHSNFELAKKTLQFLCSQLQADHPLDAFDHHLLWMKMVLNAHYTNFMLARTDPSTAELLTEALLIINELESSVQSDEDLLPVVEMVMNQRTIRPALSQNLYSVEYVNF